MGSRTSSYAPGLLLLLVVNVFANVHGHGYLVTPQSRNVLAYGVNRYEPSTGNGLGQSGVPGNPGVCGDPFQGMSTNFVNSPTAPQATYTAGATVPLTVYLNVNHGGRFEFKVCDRTSNLDQACFDRFPLTNVATGTPYYYILTGSYDERSAPNPRRFDLNFRLPSGLTCANGCVLQWTYKTYNSCVDRCPASECGFYANRENRIINESGKPYCPADGSTINVAEVFKNCADIRITSGGTTPTGKCDKCNIPVSAGGCKCDNNCDCITGTTPTGCQRSASPGGQCGSGTCCPSGQCCSRFGWCGTTFGHCSVGQGCQRGLGTCWA